jgi:hypothetical protein
MPRLIAWLVTALFVAVSLVTLLFVAIRLVAIRLVTVISATLRFDLGLACICGLVFIRGSVLAIGLAFVFAPLHWFWLDFLSPVRQQHKRPIPRRHQLWPFSPHLPLSSIWPGHSISLNGRRTGNQKSIGLRCDLLQNAMELLRQPMRPYIRSSPRWLRRLMTTIHRSPGRSRRFAKLPATLFRLVS